MNIPPKYEDVVAQLEAALGRETALREELEHEKSNLRSLTHLAAVRLEMYETSQQRLTVAEQRAGVLEAATREMLRIAGIANQGSNAYNRAIINLHNALNPVETPYEYSGEDDFGHRERIDAALKPAEVGEGS